MTTQLQRGCAEFDKYTFIADTAVAIWRLGEMATSKMQKLLDKVESALAKKDTAEAVRQLIEAIKMLSRGQQEQMDRIDRIASRNPFIGGCK